MQSDNKSSSNDGKKLPNFDSNPFTISFRGFGLFATYAKGVLIAVIVVGIFGFMLNFITSLPSSNNNDNFYSNSSLDSSSNTEILDDNIDESNAGIVLLTVVAFVIGLGVLAVLFGTLFTAMISGILASAAISSVNKKEISFGQSFSEMGSRFGVLYVALLIALLKTIGGYILFIIPGIRAQLRYSGLAYVIMNNKTLSASQAVANTKDLYRNHLMESFGINTVGAIIPVIGPAITASGFALSVQQLTDYKKLNAQTPKTHWLNYIGIIFVLAIFVFMIFVSILLAILFSSIN
jgi:uncharacterized membrane protein YidH (DUF202 family)